MTTGNPRLSPRELGDARRVRRAYEQVAEQLQESIVSGTLPAGSKLPPEPELAEYFGTSRSTIREALRILASQQFVETRPGNSGGSVIVKPSEQRVSEYLMSTFALWTDEAVDLGDLFDAREALEAAAVTWAAERAADRAVEELSACIPDDVTVLDEQAILRFDRGFHEAILRLADNKIITTVSLPIYNVLNKRVERPLITPAFWSQTVEEHRRLMLTIASGDAHAARLLMAEHMHAVRTHYTAAWKEDDE